MIGSGIILGIVFDIYRVVQRWIRIRGWFVTLLDLMYWISATFFVFWVLLTFNDGQIRFYILVALIVGLWFYFSNWSSFVQKFVLSCIHVLEVIWKWLLHLFDLLVVRPAYMLFWFAGFVGMVGMTGVYHLGRLVWIFLTPVIWLLKLLYRWLMVPIRWLWAPVQGHIHRILLRVKPIVKPWLSYAKKAVHWFKRWLKT